MGLRHVYINGNSSTGTEIQIGDSWTVQENMGNKSYFNFTIKDLNGATLSAGSEITLYDDTTLIWGGSIKKWDDQAVSINRLEYSVNAEDYNELVERILIVKGFTNESIGTIVNYLVTNYFSQYGVTAGTITATTILNKCPFNYVYGHSALNHLRTFGNYVWNIDKNKKLHFQKIGYAINSTPIVDASLSATINEFRRSQTLNHYRNRQYVKGTDRLSVIQNQKTPTPTPNSSNREFFTKYKIGLDPTIEVNRGSGWVAQTVGIKGLHDNNNNQWWWNYGSTQITHDENETVLSATDQIRVTYYGLIPLLIVTQDSSEVASRGYYDAYDYNPLIENQSDALNYSSKLLDKYANTADTFKFRMYEKTYEIGEQVLVNTSTLRTVNEYFIIKSCNWSPRGNYAINYDYDILDGTDLGGWEDFFEKLIETTKVKVDSEEIIIISEQVEEEINLDGQYTIRRFTPLYPNTTLYPSNTLYPGTLVSSIVVSD